MAAISIRPNKPVRETNKLAYVSQWIQRLYAGENITLDICTQLCGIGRGTSTSDEEANRLIISLLISSSLFFYPKYSYKG